MSEGRDLEQQARKFLNLPELRAAWTSTQTTMFNILVEFGAALRAETPTPRDEEAEALIEQVYQDLGRVGKVMNATYARIERWRERAETPAPRDQTTICLHCRARMGTPHAPLCRASRAAGEPEQAK